jgi:hypothetical protein
VFTLIVLVLNIIVIITQTKISLLSNTKIPGTFAPLIFLNPISFTRCMITKVAYRMMNEFDDTKELNSFNLNVQRIGGETVF